MEQYPVPQFIESEAKITTFLTMKQFLYLVIAGAIILILYFSGIPFSLFIVLALLIGGTAVALGFIKIDGIPLLTILLNSLGFFSKAKSYTWKKKESIYPLKTIQIKKASLPLRKLEEEKPLAGGQKSELKKLRTKVELRIK